MATSTQEHNDAEIEVQLTITIGDEALKAMTELLAKPK
jgi:hypothetical protein